jgi:hypothetical protein
MNFATANSGGMRGCAAKVSISLERKVTVGVSPHFEINA